MSIWTDLTTFTRDTRISCWVYYKHYLPVKPHLWQWGVEMLPDMFVYFYFTHPFLSCHSFLLIYTCLIHPSIHPSTSIHPKKKYCPTCRTWGHRLSLYFPYLPTFFEGQKYLITAAPSGIDFQQQFLQSPTSRWSIRSTDNQSAL